uniref:Cyanobacterial aminoacyl-tRNA synthetase CAAD domain-containing protein n=1 Tax=Setaria italica TaxID=4555 RepID=K3Y2G8_SETIT
MEDPVAVAVPFAPLDQSLVPVDSVGALGSKCFLCWWILSAIVSALDSIPLLPKILEIVGLEYTIWFGTRYLPFKENRDELLVKVEDLKRRIVGSGDE